MGRKSLAVERQNQILDAFEQSIVQHGLDGATMQRISDAAGVKLSMIPHYFGNREGLVESMIDRFLTTYQADFETFLTSFSAEMRLQALLDLYFGDRYSDYRPQDTVIMTELMGLAEREPKVKAQLLAIYQLFEQIFCEELQRTYPDAEEERCQKAAHVILSIWYGNATFIWLGFDPAQKQWARETVEMIIKGVQSDAN